MTALKFDDRRYTEDALIKQLGLIELHSKDGSALDAGCSCIESKHLYMVEGLAEEGAGFAMSEKERKFYEELANKARNLRKTIENQDFNIEEEDRHEDDGVKRCMKRLVLEGHSKEEARELCTGV